MKGSVIAGICFCVALYSGAVLADGDRVSAQLKNVLDAHFVATSKDSESIEDVMTTMHSESPASMHIKFTLEQMFPAFDMNVSLREFSFVGLDGDYAIARVKRKMEKISGPATFKNQIIEQLYVFKQEQNQWKIWQAVGLDVEHF